MSADPAWTSVEPSRMERTRRDAREGSAGIAQRLVCESREWPA